MGTGLMACGQEMTRDYAFQPLDAILMARGFNNEDLVRASTMQLTFKQVQKARTGRKVTLNIQNKILAALNACDDRSYLRKELFNY